MTEELPQFPTMQPTRTVIAEHADNGGGITIGLEANDVWVGYSWTYDDARAVRDELNRRLEPFMGGYPDDGIA